MFKGEVLVVFHENCVYNRPYKDDHDGSDRDYFRIMEFHLDSCMLNKGPWTVLNKIRHEVVPVDFKPGIGDEFWLTVVRYTSGDSFGQEKGRGQPVCGFKEVEDTKELEEAIKDGDHHHSNNDAYKAWAKEQENKQYRVSYPYWHFGYFDSLEGIETYRMVVEPSI